MQIVALSKPPTIEDGGCVTKRIRGLLLGVRAPLCELPQFPPDLDIRIWLPPITSGQAGQQAWLNFALPSEDRARGTICRAIYKPS